MWRVSIFTLVQGHGARWTVKSQLRIERSVGDVENRGRCRAYLRIRCERASFRSRRAAAVNWTFSSASSTTSFYMLPLQPRL